MVTWVVPHSFAYEHPQNVDMRLMSIFVEFYTTMLGFVNYRLYHNLNVIYPPTLITNVVNTMMSHGKDEEPAEKVENARKGKFTLQSLGLISYILVLEVGGWRI